jgi:GPI-anchor transamidase subunit GAA1
MAQPPTNRGFSLPSLTALNPTRTRTYLLRLPLYTRLSALAIVALYILELQTVWSVIEWGSLKPSAIGLFSGGMYRLNTYIFIHRGFWHMLINLLAYVPLMERFEKEWGTLTTLALWLGPLATIPGGVYLGVEYGLLGWDGAVCGASVVVFLLVASEAAKSWRVNPSFE